MEINNIMNKVIKRTGSISIRCLIAFILLKNLVYSIPQGDFNNRDSCQVDADCQKGGQTNRCCSQFYFCGTGPDYCAEGM